MWIVKEITFCLTLLDFEPKCFLVNLNHVKSKLQNKLLLQCIIFGLRRERKVRKSVNFQFYVRYSYGYFILVTFLVIADLERSGVVENLTYVSIILC